MREVFFLTSGTFVSPTLAVGPSRLVLPSKSTTLSNTVAVAVRDSGDVVLVDVGWSAEACANPVQALGRLRTMALGMRAKSGDAIVDQLRALGIDPARVTTIVATHLHLDHIGGACDFPNAEVVCTDDELAAFREGGATSGYRADDLARTGRARTVRFDAGPTYGFPASHDLFADGAVVLCDARGHTKGLAAVALRTKSACFMHVGDAVYQRWEYGLAPAGPSLVATFTGWKKDAMRASYAAIRACEADPRKPTIVPSHDMSVFEKLPHAPAA